MSRASLAFEHPWDLAPRAAIALQRELAARVRILDEPHPVRTLAGVDVGFEMGGRVTRAAVAVLDALSLEQVARNVARVPTRFPYVPGLLSFRELPAVLEAVKGLDALPDLFLCDGQGRAHPRRFGIACHLGVLLDRPAIGVAKRRLTGSHELPGPHRGDWVPLRDREETIGVVLRTRRGVKPVYVSVGHRVSLERARHWVLASAPRYKLPEPIRQAHRLASGDGKAA